MATNSFIRSFWRSPDGYRSLVVRTTFIGESSTNSEVLYWSSPTISLGYHQKKYPLHWENLTWKGQKLDLVRRPTGGRAVLHQGDLTYAVITSDVPGSRIEAYKKICTFLIQGWQKLGLDLHYGTAGRGYIHNPNCFGTATSADLVLPDRTKFIGSAQLRKGNVILQHGSMRLKPEPELFTQVFDAESFTSVKLPDTLESYGLGAANSSLEKLNSEKLNSQEFNSQEFNSQKLNSQKLNFKQINLEKIVNTLVDSAIDCFGIKFEINPLSEFEWQNIAKFGNR